jgi:hypothetical protein
MKAMIRKLFIEPMINPLDGPGIQRSDTEESQIIENLASIVLNPGSVISSSAGETIKFLDETTAATPATARVLMAYVCGKCVMVLYVAVSKTLLFCNVDLTLGMENLYWLLRPRKDKKVARDDISRAFTAYRASAQRRQVHSLIRDYIGDENVSDIVISAAVEVHYNHFNSSQIIQSFSREKALAKVTEIIAKSRYVISFMKVSLEYMLTIRNVCL